MFGMSIACEKDLWSSLGEQLNLASLFDKNSPLRKIFVNEPMKKDPELFASSLSRIPVF